MRLYNHINRLNEGIDLIKKHLIEEISRDCKPFLNDLRKTNINKFLYSGRKNHDIFIKNKVHRKRKPKDTFEDIHEWTDDWLYGNFGIRGRSNTLFCTSLINQASSYGNPYIIFPKGRYEIIWSPQIRDMYTVMEKDNNFNAFFNFALASEEELRMEYEDIYGGDEWEYKYRDVGDISFDEYIERRKEQEERELIKLMKTYRKGDLKNALESGNEVMLHTKEYYGIHSNYFHTVKNFVWGK